MIDKASNCFRIGTPQWMPKNRHDSLLDLLERHRAAADEITYFTSESHPPLPLDTMRDRIALVSERLTEARERGWRAGINILSTIGHHNENLPHSLDEPYQRGIDSQGRVCRGMFCPNDERFIE